MTPTTLQRVGEALYGDSWKRPLARDLGISERALYRWLDGSRTIPASLSADLARLAEERAVRLHEIAGELV